MTTSYRSANSTLEKAVATLGGPFAVANRLWPSLSRQTGYDRVYRWLERGRVPGTALGPFVAALRAAGVEVTDDTISALGGWSTLTITKVGKTGASSVRRAAA